MRRLVPSLIALCLALPAWAANPVTNGSFEAVEPSGEPADWNVLGQGEVISPPDAPDGSRVMRLVRPADAASPETGLNREWLVDSGARGTMLSEKQGGIVFQYKAVEGNDRELAFHVIPMNDRPFEATGASRATFLIPESHIGDGQWHEGRLAYDFTDAPEVAWVQVSPRLMGSGPAELWLDAIRWVPEVGPLLNVDGLRMLESDAAAGARATVTAVVRNGGDRPARNAYAALEAPVLQTEPARIDLGDFAPGAARRVKFTLVGRRLDTGSVDLVVAGDDLETRAELRYAPALEAVSFGPVTPVALLGDEVAVEYAVENTGHAFVRDIEATFTCAGETKRAKLDGLAPGRRAVLRAAFTPATQSAGLAITGDVGAANAEAEDTRRTSRLVVGADVDVPPHRNRAAAYMEVTEDYALLENRRFRLIFRRNAFGFGPGEIQSRGGAGWRTAAWLPRLSHLRRAGEDGRDLFAPGPPQPFQMGGADVADAFGGAVTPRGVSEEARAGLWFTVGGLSMQFSATSDGPLAIDYRYTAPEAMRLARLDGPMVYVLDRSEAVFPGVEWLVDDEVSSSTLDIREGHEHQVRYVPHPNMVTIPAMGISGAAGTLGLVWPPLQPQAGEDARVASVFGSPDRWNHQRAHLMGLRAPSAPDHTAPGLGETAAPLEVAPRDTIELRARLVVDGSMKDALAPIDAWTAWQGWPAPNPIPEGGVGEWFDFSMAAYLDTLYVPETREWWTTKNGPPQMSYKTRPDHYLADMVLGMKYGASEAREQQVRRFASDMARLMDAPLAWDRLILGGTRAGLAWANPEAAANALAGRGEAGLWWWDPDPIGTGVFEGMDYYTLGEGRSHALGTSAATATQVLRYALRAGDRAAYEEVVPTLEFMETYRVPRAAQVWEVPFHTPDILAAADAVDAYVAAYRFSGEERWLRDAVAFARKGLPFVYLWQEPGRDYMLGGSIPVLGATFYTHSWFARPVQWNGLRYANALLSLAEHDDSYPWRRIAELVVGSAIHQQARQGEDEALWPDAISVIDGEKSAWVFAPRQIIRNVLKLEGIEEDPQTVFVEAPGGRVPITARGPVTSVVLGDGALAFDVAFAPGDSGSVLIANVTRPEAVRVGGRNAVEQGHPETADRPAWRYDTARAFLVVRVPQPEAAVRVEGVAYREATRLAEERAAIDFTFDADSEGWMATNDITNLRIDDGALAAEVTGGDPYITRSRLRVFGDAAPALRLRMRTDAQGTAQLYWTTAAQGGFSEERVVHFTLRPGAMETYEIPVGQHPQWRGQVITGLRLDPGNGQPGTRFAIDALEGATPR